ncbi:type III restriction-modification system endonuclease [Fonticella tunisiensis]|uniref:Type III restriction enzyme n=1 Tax=Fonticella tunisiensis TaxID=1096341 RepID=A0A4R7KTD1_9CLOT|nr:DEAD/DEAH box helicase family protein [Fonticella tunisiensis]TDT63348.1 type III restriction enzyme [Fonticella tunisiensis]
MKLQFKSDLKYQLEAVMSVVDIFSGQPVKQSNFTVITGEVFGIEQRDLGIGNRLELTQDEILKNLQQVQMRNGLPRSEKLEGMNFTVEMETGTGKTYVYLRTIYELNKNYGFTKFIVVVPSVAIREGVYKTIQITKEHFDELYDNAPVDYFIYDSSKLDQVRNFATSPNIQIMIINIDAFRKSFVDPEKEDKANIIHRPNDRLNGLRPIDYIKETNPIVIIDEPQSVDTTDKSKEAIASLNPICTLRYSATHVDKYNMVYRLDAVDAYEQKLVKRIEVLSVKSEEAFNLPYIKLLEVGERKAKIELDVESRGKVRRTSKTVKLGDDLFDISGEREIYRGYKVEDISWGEGEEYIEINGIRIDLNQSVGDIDDDEIKRFMIRKTIEEHLDKELKLRHKGIKVLSLFFIDRVANYRDYDGEGNPVKGKYAKMFEEEYRKLIKKHKYNTLFKDIDVDAEIERIHNGYFAQDKKGRLKDTKGNTEADNDVYNLIMRDKERLLSLDEPLRFIFSHSALREGWDNPNVFQICTLKDSSGTYVSRRQEIGRGLRLAVDNSGKRIEDPNINTLTVMANESYKEFVEKLQTEIEEDTGIRFGVVEKHIFAGLSFTNEDGEAVPLGYEKSEKLYDLLTKRGYIDKDGKMTAVLKEALENEQVELSYEFNNWYPAIIRELKHRASRLKIKDANKKTKVQLNKAVLESEDFKALWDKIKQKTIYSLDFDSEKLIEKCVENIMRMPKIHASQLVSQKARINIERDMGVSEQVVREDVEEVNIKNNLPDILTDLQNKTSLTRKTLVEILIKSNRLEDFKRNPQKFIEQVAEIIKRELRLFVADGIKYHKINDYYAVELFNSEELLAYLNENAVKSKKSPFDHVLYDSDIEESFAKKFENDERVKVYVKLPGWFKIDTPLGSYNPDWAVVIDKDGEEKLYFVVETKGTDIFELLRPEEQLKIKCAEKHFKELGTEVEFRAPVKDAERFMRV